MKEILKNIILESAHLFTVDCLVRFSKQGLILPFYHTVSDDDLPHIKHLYPVRSKKQFEEDLDFFQKHYKPVSHKYLLNRGLYTTYREKQCFYLTFDDGLRQFSEVVAPILLARGISATCFVNSAFVDNKDMFYRLKASILIEAILKTKITKAQQSDIVDLFQSIELSYKLPIDLLRIKDKDALILDKIAQVLNISFDEYLEINKPYLTTPEIESLIQQGFTIGAHSVSHPYYPELTEEQQISETLQCSKYLVDKFKIEDRLFSFPYTDFEIKKTFFDKIKNEIDLTFGTANLKLDTIENHFQRIPMELSNKKNAAAIVKQAYFLFIVKMLLGRHIINRT